MLLLLIEKINTSKKLLLMSYMKSVYNQVVTTLCGQAVFLSLPVPHHSVHCLPSYSSNNISQII